MTKTLFDPEVEKRGIEKGIEQGIEKGIEKGIEIGRGVGKGDILCKMLAVKLKSVPNKYKDRLISSKEEVIEEIALNIFNIEKIEDLDKYLH